LQKEDGECAATYAEHRQETTDWHNPFPIAPKPIRWRHWRLRWSFWHDLITNQLLYQLSYAGIFLASVK